MVRGLTWGHKEAGIGRSRPDDLFSSWLNALQLVAMAESGDQSWGVLTEPTQNAAG